MPRRDHVLMQAARKALRRAEGLGWTSPTKQFCPTCHRATIHRDGGEWCRWCRGWIQDLVIYKGQEQAAVTRVLGSYRS